MSKEELNKLEQAVLKIQCINKYYEAVRNYNIHGVYRLTTVKNLMLGVIGNSLKSIRAAGCQLDKMPVNLVKPDNDRTYTHIVIPPDTMLLDLPSYLQETDYGVYNGGIGTFIQYYDSSDLPHLFIYPAYSKTLYKEPIRKLMIYNANTILYDNIKNTFRLDGDILNIIGTSKTKVSTNVANAVIDKGVSFMSANPNKLLENNSHPTDDKLYVSSKNTLIKQEAYEVRDKNANTKYVGHQDNLFKERSTIAMRTFQIVQVQWNFCNIDLIYPGMPVIYNYADESLGLIKMVGTVVATASIYNKATKNTTGLINIAVNAL
jgi:hypothetical protein